MHILHLIKTGDGAKWALDLIRKMSLEYPDLVFSVVVPKAEKTWDAYVSLCQNVFDFRYVLGMNTLRNGIKLRKIVKEVNPDVIHSWFTQTTFYSRIFLRGLKIPVVFQVVGPLHLESAIFRFLDVRSATKYDFWIASSRYILKKYLSVGVSSTRVLFNYPFIDLDRLKRDMQTATGEHLTLYNIPETARVIGTASYIYPPKFGKRKGVKGHDILLKVFSKLLDQGEDLYLVVAGTTFGSDKTYEDWIRKEAGKISRERIIFTGGYNNIYDVLSKIDVFVYLSRSENLGGVFESLFYMVPTVSSDKGALPELVEDGVTGFSCALESKEIVSKIKLLLSDLEYYKQRFGPAGRDRVYAMFNEKRIISTARNIYKEVTSAYV